MNHSVVGDIVLLVLFSVKLSHTLDTFLSFETVQSLFCKAHISTVSIRELFNIKSDDVDGLIQMEPVLNWNRFSIPIPIK